MERDSSSDEPLESQAAAPSDTHEPTNQDTQPLAFGNQSSQSNACPRTNLTARNAGEELQRPGQITSGDRTQPPTSNAAMMRFRQRARGIGSASQAATLGSRRLSESDIGSLFAAAGISQATLERRQSSTVGSRIRNESQKTKVKVQEICRRLRDLALRRHTIIGPKDTADSCNHALVDWSDERNAECETSSDDGSMATTPSGLHDDPESLEDAAQSRDASQQEMVNRLMSLYFRTFHSSSPLTVPSGSNPDSEPQSTQSSSRSMGGGSGWMRSSSRSSISINLPPRTCAIQSNGNEDGSGPKVSSNNNKESKNHRLRRFACPYFKRSPAIYTAAEWRSCCGPGWDSVPRVKEHLYRRHERQIQCPRCWLVVDDEDALGEHLQLAIPCERCPKVVAEGFDHKQKKKLKSRKRSCPDQSEEQRWKDVYGILFPEDDEIPSPYYDFNMCNFDVREHFATCNDFARYEEWLSEDLPRRVRRRLEVAVDRNSEPIEEELQNQLVEIVQEAQRQAFQSYHEGRTLQHASTPIYDHSSPQPQSNSLSTGQDFQAEPSQSGGPEQLWPSTPALALGDDWLSWDVEAELLGTNQYEPNTQGH